MTKRSKLLMQCDEPFPAMQFSDVADEIPEAVSISFNQMVYDLKRAGRDVITLSLGEAFFHIPLFDFNRIDYVKGYHYSDSRGIPELRARIASFYRQQYGVHVDGTDDLLVSAGSKILIYLSMLVTLNPGDEVLLHEPFWLSYPEQVKLCRAHPKPIPYNVPLSDFGRFITSKTRMVVLTNPNNPAGRIYSMEALRHLYDICRSRGVYILIDEAYSDFVDDGGFTSLGAIVPTNDNVIIVNSLSKNMGISGWRIGYVIGHPNFVERLLKVNQHLITCAPTLLQLYCAKYFDSILNVTLPQVADTIRKRQRISLMLDELGLKHLGGEATFYFFVDINPYPGTSFEFASNLLREKAVCVVPGSAYGASTDRFIRVSIGAESDERIQEGLMLIKELSQTASV